MIKVPAVLFALLTMATSSACTRTSYQHQGGDGPPVDGPPVDGHHRLDLASDEQGVVVAVQLKNVQYATCVQSTPLGMATCDSSSLQQIEFSRGEYLKINDRYRLTSALRFAGTDDCLKLEDKQEIIKQACRQDEERFRWIHLELANEKWAFESLNNGNCLKVSGSGLRAGDCSTEEKHKWLLL